MESTDPQVFDHLAINSRSKLSLINRWQCGPWLSKLTLSKFLREQQLQTLLHLTGSLIGEGHRQKLTRIHTVVADQVGDPMRKRPGFAATCACNHQQRTGVVINRPALGVVQTRKKAQGTLLRSAADRYQILNSGSIACRD